MFQSWKKALLGSYPENSRSKTDAIIININSDYTILARQLEDLQTMINRRISMTHNKIRQKKNYELAQKRAGCSYKCMESFAVSKEAYYFSNFLPIIIGLINFIGMYCNNAPLVTNLIITAIVGGSIALPTWGSSCTFFLFRNRHNNAQQEMKKHANNFEQTIDLLAKATTGSTNAEISDLIFKYADLPQEKESLLRNREMEERSAPTCQPHTYCCR